MEGTLTGMHTLLKQMRAKAATSPKDPLVKANLEMWELLVGHLDKQLLELRTTVAARDDLEARRAAMYKQADEKAAAAAQAARKANAAQAQAAPAAAAATVQNAAAPSQAAPAPAAQSIPTQPASSTPSPN
jgi:peptidoglycan hydrolase CwlO-like protein